MSVSVRCYCSCLNALDKLHTPLLYLYIISPCLQTDEYVNKTLATSRKSNENLVCNIFNTKFKIRYRSTLFEGYTANFSSYPAQRRSDIDLINYGYFVLDYEPANNLGIGSISLIVSHLIFSGSYHIPYMILMQTHSAEQMWGT